MAPDATMTWLLPIGFGLMGFIEPCAIGMTLLFVFTLEGRSPREKVWQTALFTAMRTLVMGLLGVVAAAAGAWIFTAQKAVWLVVGVLYIAIGVMYLTGRIAFLKQSIGVRIASLSSRRSAALMGALFALNIPACAAPLLLALLAAAAAQGATGQTLAQGFVMLALFGFALSLPIVAAVLIPAARRFFDRLATLATRLGVWTGLVFIGLGLWTIWFGLYVVIA